MEKIKIVHDTNALFNYRIKSIFDNFGFAGYGIFWAVVDTLNYYQTNKITDINAFASIVAGITKNAPQDIKNIIKSIICDFGIFYTNDNKTYYLDIKKTNRERQQAPKPPTLDEVEEYINTNDCDDVDALTFWQFYQSKGWKKGRVNITDWRIVVDEWQTRKKQEKANNKNNMTTYQQRQEIENGLKYVNRYWQRQELERKLKDANSDWLELEEQLKDANSDWIE